MTNNRAQLDLSRRRLLAGLGTIGVASAGAGLGTTAYFSDREEFDGNRLVAGDLDLKVGWEEHYSDWSDDENDGLDGSIAMESGASGGAADISNSSTRVGLPANVASLVSAVNSSDTNQFLDNTQEDSYPSGYDSQTLPDSINCTLSERNDNNNILNSDGEVILADDDLDAAAPVIELDDVKPGDFGEVTFSFALCSNPGYIWAGAFLQDASENGVTEPEGDDPDEIVNGTNTTGDPSGLSDDYVELLDEIQVAVWLDDGNNFQNCGEQPLTVGSLRDVINGNAPNIENNGLRLDGRNVELANAAPTDFTAVGVNRFDTAGDGSYDADVDLTDDPVDSGKVAHATSDGAATDDYVTTSVCLDERPTLGELTDDPTNPSTTLTYEYYGGPDNGNSAPDEVYLLIEEADGTQNVVFRASNDGAPADETWKTRNVHREVAGNPDNNPGFNWMHITSTGVNNLGGGGATSDLSTIFGDDAEVLAMAAGRGTTGGGDVLDTYYRNPEVGGSSAGSFATSCFRGDGTVYHGVFAWWLPVDHANEIQTDSVTFDLGLYTEQCRHNPGDGPAFDTQ